MRDTIYHIIQRGDLLTDNMSALGTSTLVVGDKLYLVDTGSMYESSYFLSSLNNKLNLQKKNIKDIKTVIITHPDMDHTGNNHLFKHAQFIYPDSTWVRKGDYNTFNTKIQEELAANGKHNLEESIELMLTPGHRTKQDISVLLKNTYVGVVCIAGDAFLYEGDDELFENDPTNCGLYAAHPELILKSRAEIKRVADWIVPGHGAPFEVK